jgi:hypothetical protein
MRLRKVNCQQRICVTKGDGYFGSYSDRVQLLIRPLTTPDTARMESRVSGTVFVAHAQIPLSTHALLDVLVDEE